MRFFNRPWVEIFTNPWADSMTAKYLKRDFAIRLGMLAAGSDIDCTLEVKETTGNTMVNQPHVFEIVASRIIAIKYEKNKKFRETWKDFTFTAHSKSYSVRSITHAVKKVWDKNDYKTRERDVEFK